MAVAEDRTDDAAPAAVTAPPRRRRRVARHVARHSLRLVVLSILATAGFLIAFGLLVAMAVFDRPVTLPAWVTTKIESAMNRGVTAGRITLDRVEVRMNGLHAPEVRLRNLSLYDDRGAEVARLNEVGAGFDLERLLRGKPMPSRLRLSGAQITLRRRSDGGFDLSFGGGAGPQGSLPLILDRIDRMFTDGPLAPITQIDATDLTISLEDARVARIWQVTGGHLQLTQTPDAIEMAVGFDVFNGTETLATTALTFRSDKRTAAAEIGATFANAAAKDIALQSPVLAFLGVLDAPISGSLRLAVNDAGALSTFVGSLEIGRGALTPGPRVAPLEIDGGKAYFTYDPAARRLDFTDLSVQSDAAAVHLSGAAFLRDLRPDGWPQSLVGQFRILNLMARADDWLDQPAVFSDGRLALKLTLDPFRLKIGRLRLAEGQSTIDLAGEVAATGDGLRLDVDASVDRIDKARLMALWPTALLPGTRAWLDDNILGGEITGARAGFRHLPGQPNRLLVGFGFEQGAVRWLATMPPITAVRGYASIDGDRLVLTAEKGTVTPPEGGAIDIAGTVMSLPDMRRKPAPLRVDLKARGPITSVLSLLDQPPLTVMRRAGRPVDLAQGQADVTATVELPLQPKIGMADIRYTATGALDGVASDRIVPGRDFAAAALHLAATPDGVTIDGPARFSGLPVRVRWTQGIGDKAGTPGRVEGQVELSPAALDAFGIALPRGSVSGKGSGDITIDLPPGGAPRFRLTSDLTGLALRLDAVSWTKPAGAKGRLLVEGVLGDRPKIDRIEIAGAGLTATGAITLKPGGGLDEARFSRVTVGGWLDAPVTLVGRGSAQPAVRVTGGSLDLRRAAFGGAAGGGDGGPVTVALDRLTIADGIALTGFRGDFTTRGGFSGRFTAKLNGGGTVNGSVAPQNGGTAVKVVSDNAGEVLKDANLAQRIRGGAMTLILTPAGQEGVYNGTLSAERVRVRGTPALAELLNAVSVVGLLQQLNGDGIVFDQVQTQFVLTPRAVNLVQFSAIGASLGISAQGSIELGTGQLNLRGVFSPVYLLNGIGQIFSRKGEGLFGFNYNVRGTADDPQVGVNPLSVLTPGMFREIFRTAPPPAIK